MICFDCKQKILYNDWLDCKGCNRRHHYHCQNITSADFREHGERLKDTWKCSSCQNVTRRTRNDDTPIRGKNVEEGESVNKETLKQPLNKHKSNDYKISFEDFSSLLDTKLHKMEQSITEKIKKDLNEAIEQLKVDFTRTTDFLAAEQVDLKNKLEATNKLIKTLDNEKLHLSKELVEMSGRLRTLENASRSCNFEIHAVPELKQEDLTHLVKNICVKVGVPITEQDIRFVRRVARLIPSTDYPRNILASVNSQFLRDNIVSAFKNYNKEHSSSPFNSSTLGIPGNERRIYVVEHYPPEVKKLHAAARKIAKEKSYAYVWVKHGRVYVRKTDNATPIQLKSIDCLNNLK